MKLIVWIVKHHQTDTWNAGAPYFCVAAISEEAAKRWIEMETKSSQYAQGPSYTPEWWISYGTFSITEVEVFNDDHTAKYGEGTVVPM